MSFFSKLFKNKKLESSALQNETQEPSHTESNRLASEDNSSFQIKTVPISSVNEGIIPEGATPIYESEIPASCSIGNLVFEKRYEEAIELGLSLLSQNPNDPGVHINLMEAYFKSRDSNPEFFDKSTYHAKRAMLCGHNTGLAEDRLAKNLDKEKLFHQSLQLYNLILDNPDFHFSTHGMGNGIDFNKRRENILKKMDKAADSEADILFSTEEIAQIIQSIRENDSAEEAERKATEERIAMLEKQAEEALRNLKL